MKKVNVDKLNKTELVELHEQIGDIIFAESRANKEKYMEESAKEWAEIGQEARKYRESKNVSLKELAEYMSRSSTTLSRFERGLPVMKSRNIQRSYFMLVDLIAKSKEESKIAEMIEKYDCILHQIFQVAEWYTDIEDFNESVECYLYAGDLENDELIKMFNYHANEYKEYRDSSNRRNGVINKTYLLTNALHSAIKLLDRHGLLVNLVLEAKQVDGYGIACSHELNQQIGKYLELKQSRNQVVNG